MIITIIITIIIHKIIIIYDFKVWSSSQLKDAFKFICISRVLQFHSRNFLQVKVFYERLNFQEVQEYLSYKVNFYIKKINRNDVFNLRQKCIRTSCHWESLTSVFFKAGWLYHKVFINFIIITLIILNRGLTWLPTLEANLVCGLVFRY